MSSLKDINLNIEKNAYQSKCDTLASVIENIAEFIINVTDVGRESAFSSDVTLCVLLLIKLS